MTDSSSHDAALCCSTGDQEPHASDVMVLLGAGLLGVVAGGALAVRIVRAAIHSLREMSPDA